MRKRAENSVKNFFYVTIFIYHVNFEVDIRIFEHLALIQ